MLNIINEHNYNLFGFEKDFRKILLSVKKRTSFHGEKKSLSVSFSSEEEIVNLNQKYRNLNKESDVLSFPFTNDFISDYLGDIVICYPIAVRQAEQYCHSLRREFSFLFLHGLLHLFGYDHVQIEDEEIMFSLQEDILQKLGITRETKNPLPSLE